MEKRFALFLILSALVLVLHMVYHGLVHPPEAPREAPPEPAPWEEPLAEPPLEEPDVPPIDEPDPDPPPPVDEPVERIDPDPVETPPEPLLDPPPEPEVEPEHVTLGSLAGDSPYRLLVTLTNRGAAIERIEMGRRRAEGGFRYRQLDRHLAYLGHLALSDAPEGGARIGVVGDGTPAALARPVSPDTAAGLETGDVIRQLDDWSIESSRDVYFFLQDREPNQTVRVTVRRPGADDEEQELEFLVDLTDEPLNLIQPEINPHADTGQPDPLSFLLTLLRVGERTVERGRDEISGLAALRDGYWEVHRLDEEEAPGVEFRKRLPPNLLERLGVEGDLEIAKRYSLAAMSADAQDAWDSHGYHLNLEIAIHNRGSEPQQVAYRLDGPNGLALEGWWYTRKIHPRRFAGVGARDVVWRTPAAGHNMIGAPEIYREASEAEERQVPLSIPLFDIGQQQLIEYVGVDSQYFSVVLMPDRQEDLRDAVFAGATAMPAGPVGEKPSQWVKTTNSTFRLDSPVRTLEPGEAWSQRFTVFAGPKRRDLLNHYGLDDLIAWGWFWMIARPLSRVLHFFAWLPLVNYGLAIILLTVLVRSAMTPLSRKAARNAQMMQELAPEMKRIAEKYKNDMEKRAAAQRDLFAKHNYNPLGGCLLMFVQLPIFVGLYRALSIDIQLLQEPLIPGLQWCSNLAGPDMLWYWEPYLPAILANPGTGWLGPYLNVLPILTIVLFLLQQKMFMPPATDEQTQMQHRMMKFMMIFMGVLFFKVPSGLCVYFIASSLWGIAERKFLPPAKPTPGGPATSRPAPRPDNRSPSNGDPRRSRSKKRPKKR